jgi:hypothetical protein
MQLPLLSSTSPGAHGCCGAPATGEHAPLASRNFASATRHLVRVAGFSVAADKTIVATLAVRHERVASRATRNQLDLFRTIDTVIRIDWL